MDRKPILLKYFENKSKVLMCNFETSRDQNADLNKGNNRENFVKNFLHIVLPPKLRNIYDGEIIDKNGEKTGQLDLIIIRDDAPSIDYGGSNTYLAEGVFAIIEIKSNLNKDKLTEAKNTLEKVSGLKLSKPSFVISGNNLGRPLRIIFAYSGSELNTLFNNVSEIGATDLFDLICVLDKGVIITKGRLLHVYDKQNNNQKIEQNFIIKSSASALGFLYYYLVQYGTAFSVGGINIEDYYQPLDQWGIIGTILSNPND